MDLGPLTSSAPPWLHLLAGEPLQTCTALEALRQQTSGDLAWRVIRGGKARTVSRFFDECAAALQFPLYFGENWDALLDCLTDLSWLDSSALVLLLAEAHLLLETATAEDVHRCLQVLEHAARYWNKPAPGENLVPRSFHVLFQTSPQELPACSRRWQPGGASLDLVK